MSSKKTEIRKKVVELLLDKTQAGLSVFPNRAIPVKNKDLPAVLVYPRSETGTDLDVSTRSQRRNFTYSIEILARGKSEEELSDLVECIAEEIEVIFDGNRDLDGLLLNMTYQGMRAEYRGEGENLVASMALSYTADYIRTASC